MENNNYNITGLSEAAAQEILKQNGYNELPTQKPKNCFWLLISVLKEPMLLMILGCGVIYLLLGEMSDAMMLLTFIIVVIAITFHQERKTENSLSALRNLSSPRALVIRDSNQRRVAGRDVVLGDIIILREGDRVPADAIIIYSNNLTIDESLLTGESMPVKKLSLKKDLKDDVINNFNEKQNKIWQNKICQNKIWQEEVKLEKFIGKNQPQDKIEEDKLLAPFAVFLGTLVTQGNAIIKVIATASDTELGKIGKSLETIEDENSLLQKETAKIIFKFAIAGAILCLIVILIYGLSRGSWIKGFLSGLTLGMAMLPEEFSMVLVVFLAIGALRISKRNILTRKTSAIETLGAVNILCVDKTGTLTLNQMRLDGLFVEEYYDIEKNKDQILPEDYHLLLEYAILASQTDPFDPIEKEIKNKGEFLLFKTKHLEHLHDDWKLIREYPLSKELLALSHVWRSPDYHDYVVAAKGAPEAIADLCHFDDKQNEELLAKIAIMSKQGLRVLGVAKALFSESNLPKDQHDFHFEFVGLIGFSDPIRNSIKVAVHKAYNAGIRVAMITGDYPGIATHIASKIGLNNPEHYLTGLDLKSLSPEVLEEKIKTINVFARIAPEQKLALVNFFKKSGNIVAIAGDGVNDAPALKASHVGIAMGKRGTDVAREASDLVLLDDNFSSIIRAIKLGRNIFDNLKKAFIFIFAVHIPIAAMSLLPIIFNLPIIFFPAHIAFLELIIDPACSLVFESQRGNENIMKNPPRPLKSNLFNKKDFLFSAFQGVVVLITVFLTFLWSLIIDGGEDYTRTLTFATLSFSSLMLIISNLSLSQNFIQILKNKNKALFWVMCGTLTALLLVIYMPFLSKLFHFVSLPFKDLILSFLISSLTLIFLELIKFWAKPYLK
jgi:Ca2+-transporting ATPase